MSLIQKRVPHFQKPEFVSLSNINDSSIVDFLPLTEGAGTPRNLVGNEVSLVNPNNAISWSADQTEGRVLKHGGTSDNYITWSMSDELTVADAPFTVVFTHRPDAVAVSALSVFSLGNSGAPRDTTPALLVQYNNSLLRFYINGGYRISASVSAGVLHRIAVTWKNSLWTAYLNGEEIGTFSGGNGSDRPSAYYGSGYNGSSAGVYGNLAIYSRALSSSEIRTDYERNGLQVIEPRRRWVPFSAATGTTFNQAVAGSITSTGALATALTIVQSLAGSITSTGALTFITSFKQTLTGSISATGTLARKISTSVEGSITATGSVLKNTIRVLAGSITAAGALASELSSDVLKTVTGSITATGALTKKVFRSLSGSVSSTGATTKKTSIDLDGSIGMSGDPDKGMSQDTSGSITPTGTLTASDPFVPAPDEDEAGSGSFAQRLRRIYGTVTRYRR